MKYIVLFVLSVVSLTTHAQNMVHNPSFEHVLACPTFFGQADNVHIAEWTTTNNSSPDFFDTCAYNAGVGVPSNYIGYQRPYDGKAYVGIVTFNRSNDTLLRNFREYIEGNLDTMVPGTTYYVTVHLNKGNFSSYVTNKMGVFFYRDGDYSAPVSGTPYYGPPPVTPQVEYTAATYFTDTLNWVTLTDTLVADSAYTHLVIGNFHDDAHTDTLAYNTPPGTGNDAYYYIDDVIVSTTPPVNNVGTTAFANPALYPNPAENEIILSSLPPHARITIYNVAGVQQLSLVATGSMQQVNISSLPAGIYVVRVCNNQGIALDVIRLVKQ
jgi:hypothetical protein